MIFAVDHEIGSSILLTNKVSSGCELRWRLRAPPKRAVAARLWGGRPPPRRSDGEARSEACAGRCMKPSTSSTSALEGEVAAPSNFASGVAACASTLLQRRVAMRATEASPTPARGRGAAARGSFTSRSKLPVVFRGGLGAYSSGIASLPPAGPGPSFVGANRGCLPRKASTCARLINRVSRRRP